MKSCSWGRTTPGNSTGWGLQSGKADFRNGREGTGEQADCEPAVCFHGTKGQQPPELH